MLLLVNKFKKIFDPIKFSLFGINLIESSAGTGKTFTLVIIYLRLLLNLKGEKNFPKPLEIENILVVTFTKFAAHELRHRIKETICKFRLACIKGTSKNVIFANLLLQIKDINTAINQLSKAKKKINQASIFTIHGFCRNILKQNIIELNSLFQFSIKENEKLFYQEICINFWRKNFYQLPLNIISLIQKFWKSPNELLEEIFPYIFKKKIFFITKIKYYQYDTIITCYTRILTHINKIKNEWKKKNPKKIIDEIYSYNINHKIYNKKNIILWINKINNWINLPTIDHNVPNELKRFKFSTLIKDKSNNYQTSALLSLFNLIDDLYQLISYFKILIFKKIIHEIHENFKQTKKSKSEITFNDLIYWIYNALINDENLVLSNKIRKLYPIAIIDEFQDTDQLQFKIFNILYKKNSKCGLILIGDPKQIIYSFRGADIFTYMKIHKKIKNKYILHMNWRSSPKLINSINQIFQQVPNPFIFENIPFIPTVSAYQKNTYKFIVNNHTQPAINFWLHPGKNVHISNYEETMANQCAYSIYNLLQNSHKKQSWLENKKYKKLLNSSDIVILVRNHKEASIIHSVLSKYHISAINLSNRSNIFKEVESYELLLILKAILSPTRKKIFTALATNLFGVNATEIEFANNNEFQWEKLLKEFYEYYSIWKNQGIYIMIQKLLFFRRIKNRLLSIIDGKQKLINILHLSELLQETSKKINYKHELIYWLIKKITEIDNIPSSKENLRPYIDDNPIKISTIHKSKGLEFPIVFLPFIANYQIKPSFYFHNRKTYQLCLDFNMTKKNLILANEERLAEDLRLLYVALTRSIYHCSIGIAPIVHHKNNKKSNFSKLHYSALGYLVQKNTPGDEKYLYKSLKKLREKSNKNITFEYTSKIPFYFPASIEDKSHQSLLVKTWKKKFLQKSWNLTSYSQLKYNHTLMISENFSEKIKNTKAKDLLKIINDVEEKSIEKIKITPSSHSFPRGKECGIFFHNLFQKTLNFENQSNICYLIQQMKKNNIDLYWLPTIKEWIHCITNTPLNKKNILLSQLSSKNKKTEVKFYLPINKNFSSTKLNQLRKSYDPLSLNSPSINFQKIDKMLQGFIDLIFRWNNKYYLLDYKTNWLGDTNNDYNSYNMKQEIIKHQYELQYQLYTLALHRFLKHRILSYDYKKYFGGIYYLFIRGMSKKLSKNGIYFYRPNELFIKKLDNLFLGNI